MPFPPVYKTHLLVPKLNTKVCVLYMGKYGIDYLQYYSNYSTILRIFVSAVLDANYRCHPCVAHSKSPGAAQNSCLVLFVFGACTLRGVNTVPYV